jgi:chemotaxis protein methyltransferase CheR
MTTNSPAARLEISDREFSQLSAIMQEQAGIHLPPGKKALVVGRLSKRLRHHGLKSFSEYHRFVTREDADGSELQTMVDLLTTNETYFFREADHFDTLRNRILPELDQSRELKFWSAACSSGEEVYTLAMVLADALGEKAAWSIFGSDISTEVVARARRAVYPMGAAEKIPRDYLRRFCLKGTGSQEGRFLVDRSLRERARFDTVNLNAADWRPPGRFDVIFLRNIMIYFNAATKQQLADRLAGALNPGGWLIVGHSETLNGVSDRFECIKPSVYRRKA